MGSGVAAILAAVLSIAPPSATVLSPTRVTVNDSAGNQYDPHVDDDVTAYTDFAGQRIHYYRFSTATDAFISPLLEDGSTARDELSDVDRERIVFTRIFPTGTSSIMLFNTATASLTEVAPAPSSIRMGVGLGSQTVAFIDYGITPDFSGELMVYDLSTNTLSRLTNDSAVDFNPSVSPDGATIVWEHCATMANCEIARATRAGAGWSISVVTSSLLSEINPDTNGAVTVFERQDPTGPTGTDIVISAGGAETVLEIPGEQYNPSIRGALVAFESRGGGNADIYLYELDNGRLFQVTATSVVNETLNDVTLTTGGQVRLVWQADDEGAGTNNIYGATFSLPPIDGGGGTGGGAGGGGGAAGGGTGTGGGSAGGGAGGGSAGGGAGGGGGGDACVPQSITLEASKTYKPTVWTDGVAAPAAPHTFALPAEIPVTEGNSGNHWVRLEIDTGRFRTFCRYRGGSAKAHPSTPDELAAASRYVFAFCTGEGQGFSPGSVVTATSIRLHIDNGDSKQPATRVGLTLASACPVPSASTVTNDGAGCSSTGNTLVPVVLLLAAAFLALRQRPTRIRLLAAPQRRRLPR